MIDEALKNQLLAKYADNLAKSKNQNHYLRFARDFLDNAEGLDKASIDQYIAKLPTRKHYKPGSVNFAFRVIARLFSVNQYILKAMNIEWEYRQGEAPVIGQRDEYQPQLGPRTIKMMIEAARNGKLFPDEQCFIALSTIYGLRREEIANLRSEDIDLKSSAIYIATVKHGRERYHLIPPEIQPYLAAHKFKPCKGKCKECGKVYTNWKLRSPKLCTCGGKIELIPDYALATLSQMFKRLLTKSGAGELRKKRLGWHTIRRALLDNLIDNGVNLLAARAFMRWKGASREVAMPARYFGNVIVDIGETEPVLDEAKNDEEIFQKHPFLSFWRKDA